MSDALAAIGQTLSACTPNPKAWLWLLPVFLAGCRSMGPSTIPRDRLNYSDAISESWKDQVLRNLVKMRYMDTPIFLDVGQIVGGYTWQTSISAGGTISSPKAVQGDFTTLGAQGIYTDRPTITYVPLTGDRFLRSMVEPVPPAAIFRVMQSGYAADFVLALGVDSLNGLRNRSFRGGSAQQADTNFVRAIELMRKIQEAGGVGLRTTIGPDKEKGIVMVLRRDNVSDEVVAWGKEVRSLLGLSPTADRFNLIYSPLPASSDELAVGTRSILQMLQALSTYVDVPQEDVDQKRTVSMPPVNPETKQILHVYCGDSKPSEAFVAVEYRHHWFWVDDRDWNSKRTLSTMLFLFTLSDSGTAELMPVLTIGTN